MLRRTLKWASLVLALLLLALAALVAAPWAPDRPVTSLQARWAPPPSQFVRIEGMDVHLRDEGPRDDPLPIVLIHGTEGLGHVPQEEDPAATVAVVQDFLTQRP